MGELRVLLGPDGLDAGVLDGLYAVPARPWFRANMVSTLDGIAAGPDGRSGSINNEVDRQVFQLLRRLADVIVVGAGTARTERYRPSDKPIVVVSRAGLVPETLRGAARGGVLLATHAGAPALAAARAELGDDNVLVLGEDAVDLAAMKAALVERGLTSILTEGGPSLLRDALAAGAIDELCLTWVPRLLGGEAQPMLGGSPLDVPLRLAMLLEQDGTLLGRWLT